MASTATRKRLPVLIAAATVLLAAFAGTAVAGVGSGPPAAPPLHGTLKGFATGDFAFLDALSVPSLNLTQASIAQSAAGVSSSSLQTTDTLGQRLLTSTSAQGRNAYGRGAGVSLNLGAPDDSVPKAQLTDAEAASPPRNSATTRDLVKVPLAPVATVDVQPDVASANTPSANDFCVLGAPLSEGTATVADASVVPVSSTTSLLNADGTVRDDSTEELDPNGKGALGLSSIATLNTAGITLFQGVAPITIKVVNPLVLRAFAGGVPGSSQVSFGSSDGSKDLLSISANGQTTTLTVEQVLGGAGATIPIVGQVNGQTLHLLDIEIGGKPTVSMSANGTMASAVADLVKVQVINSTGPTSVSIGGPLGPVLKKVLGPVVSTLDSLVSQLQPVIESLGLSKGVDLRIGHFEANAEVPAGGVHCRVPVTKTSDRDPVRPGEQFTDTIRVDNPYDCTLRDVRVDDHITATSGVKWTVGATQPMADKVTNAEVVWDDIGSIRPGGHKSVDVDISIDPDSASGRMSDHSHVTGGCATGNGAGSSNVSLTGRYTLHAPTVGQGPSGPELPDTGLGPALPIAAVVLLATGIGLAVLRRGGTG